MSSNKIIGIIGHCSKMAKSILIPLFEEAGHEVIGSDTNNLAGLTNREVVERADIVYFSIMPIASVASVMFELIEHARPESLWLHGTSIQNPAKGPIKPVLLDERLLKKKVDVGYAHFMVGPKVKSLRGQSVVYGFYRLPTESLWEGWLVGILRSQHCRILKYSPETHDKKTAGSQLIHMVMSLIEGSVMKKLRLSVSNTLQMAGPPGWLHLYGAYRSLGQRDIIASIIVNHPHSMVIVKEAIRVLRDIEVAYKQNKESSIAEIAEDATKDVPEKVLRMIQRSTDWHIRLEGDMRSGAVCFVFSKEENRIGLLTEVLKVFDEYKLDKTSCMAQEMPDGGCAFNIGVKADINDLILKEACSEVISKLGGQVAAV